MLNSQSIDFYAIYKKEALSKSEFGLNFMLLSILPMTLFLIISSIVINNGHDKNHDYIQKSINSIQVADKILDEKSPSTHIKINNKKELELNKTLEQYKSASRPFDRTPGNHSAGTALIKFLAKNHKEGFWVEEIHFDSSSKSFILKGSTLNQGLATNVLEQLKEQTYLSGFLPLSLKIIRNKNDFSYLIETSDHE